MAGYIYQGSTPIIRFKPLDGIRVDDPSLGTPTVAISQDEIFFSYEGEEVIIDSEENTVSVQMDETETILLVNDIPALAQLVFSNVDTGEVVRFPIHELQVLRTIIDITLEDEPEEDEEPEEEDEEVFPDEVLEDPVGELVDGIDYGEYQLEDYVEYYGDTLEESFEELYEPDDVLPADTGGE